MRSLCRDTVTLYRMTEHGVKRWVLEQCCLQIREKQVEDSYNPQFQRAFLLIVPAQQQILTGDRVVGGVGPEVTVEQWESFIPANVPGLCQVQYVQPYYVMGSYSHTEAGRNLASAYD